MSPYLLHFEQQTEAAAFIAALSRFVNSPAWEAGDPNLAVLELWTDCLHPAGMAVYMNEVTYQAAATAFAPLPPIYTRPLPDSAEIILRGVHPPAWGREQAERQLTSSP